MPKLVVESGLDKGRAFVLEGPGPFLVGRDKSAHVQLTDTMTSRRHFEIEQRGTVFIVRDLQSSNGTRVNGEAITEIRIEPGAHIQAGDTGLAFLPTEANYSEGPLSGRTIAGFRVTERIGRGGMGTVYKAIQVSLDRPVALKVLSQKLVEDKNFVHLFLQEARALGRFNHPNIVQVIDVGFEDDVYFIALEYLAGGSVEERIVREGPLPVDQALKHTLDAARGLVYAHSRRLIHRDIKPGNIMLAEDGTAKIGDLGIAEFMQGPVHLQTGVSGSPHYIAPEQARGEGIDGRADLYALGVSLYQMLSGRTPFFGASPKELIMKHLKEQAPRLAELRPDVPPPVSELVEDLMAKKPEDRIASAESLVESLEPMRTMRQRSVTRRQVSRRARRKRPAYFLPVIGAVALLVIGLLALGAHRLLRGSAGLGSDDPKAQTGTGGDGGGAATGSGSGAGTGTGVNRGAGNGTGVGAGAGSATGGDPGDAGEMPGVGRTPVLDPVLDPAMNLEERAKAVLELLEGQVLGLAEARRFGLAMAGLEAFPEEFKDTEAARSIPEFRARVEAQAHAAWEQAREEAESLVDAGRVDEGLRLYAQAEGTFGLTWVSEAVDKARERVEERRALADAAARHARKQADQHLLRGANEETLPARAAYRFTEASGIYADLAPRLREGEDERAEADRFARDFRDLAELRVRFIEALNADSGRRLSANRDGETLVARGAGDEGIIFAPEGRDGASVVRTWDGVTPEELGRWFETMLIKPSDRVDIALFYLLYGRRQDAQRVLDVAGPLMRSEPETVRVRWRELTRRASEG